MKRKQYSPAIVLRLDGFIETDAQLLSAVTPKKATAYAIPGHWHHTGVIRARNGQNNPITRARVLFYALRLAGHSRDFAERVLARFHAIVDECWPPCDICPADAEQIEAFADTDEDRTYVLWKNGRATSEQYVDKLEAQYGATRMLMVAVRQRIAARVSA